MIAITVLLTSPICVYHFSMILAILNVLKVQNFTRLFVRCFDKVE